MAPARLTSLDAFRGLAVAAMIFVNNPGNTEATHPQLLHAPWHGWTFADLVFPAFLVAVGTALAYDLGRPGRRGWKVHARLARRVAVLIALGLLLNALPFDGGPLRYPGVLQRIALAYALAALLVLHTSVRVQLVVGTALLLGPWAVLSWVDVPGAGPGVLTPEGNAFGWIDRSVFGVEHMHLSRPTDPEGLLGTLPAAFQVLAGAWAGRWIRTSARNVGVALALFGAGVLAVGGGLLWDSVLPINKRIGTPSFALFTAGVALVVLAAIFAAVDVRARPAVARPFEVLGRNALVAYVGSELVHKTVDVPAWFTTRPSPLWPLVVVAGWWLVMWALWRRRIFVSV